MSVVTHNLTAINAKRNLNIVVKNQSSTAEHLSSGYRINRAADDAAGLTISETMRCQIRGLNRASKNIQDGVSFIQVADGALCETHSILQRMRELSVQAANDTYTVQDRGAIQAEINLLGEEIDNIATKTSFNGSIYPLLGDLDSEWQLPMTLANSRQELTAMQGSVVNGYTMQNDEQVYVSSVKYTGTGLPNGVIYAEINKDGITFNTEKSSPKILSSGEKWNSLSVSNLKIDQEGYIYFEYSGKNYIQFNNSGMVLVATANKSCLQANRIGLDSGIESGKMWIQTGSLENQGRFIELVNATAQGIGLQGINVTSHEDASASITVIDGAIAKVSEYRSKLGAIQNALGYTKSVADITEENTSSAESKIRDADIADEIVEYSKADILSKAGQALLAQANQSKRAIVQLLS